MNLLKIFTAVAAIILLTAAKASAEHFDSETGVDWTRNVITVKGMGIAPLNAVNYTQAKNLASKAAQVDAYRRLGEIINGVRIEGETTIAKRLKTESKTKTRVEAAIRGARVIGESSLSNGSHEVYMQMRLFGLSNSLAGAVLGKNSSVEPFPNPVGEVNPSRSHSPLQRIAKKSVEEYADSAQGDYTGLIVDCRGLKLNPVMSPVIKNSNGTKIYGHKNLDVDKIIVMGVADYVRDISHVARAGKNPLVVRAIKLEDFKSNPVVSVPDSNRILIENHATKFLRDLKVVFLYD